MSLFQNETSIEARVMRVVKQRIADAQKKHDEHCEYLDDAHDATVQRLFAEKEDKKEFHAQSLVEQIIGR